MATGELTKPSSEEMKESTEQADLAKLIAHFDMDKTMTYFVGIMGMFGELSIKIGELEQKNSEIPEILKVINNNPKPFLNMLLEKSSGEEVRTLIIAMLKLDELSPKISNLFSLAPEEKIEIGTQLQSISKEIEAAYKQSKKTRGRM